MSPNPKWSDRKQIGSLFYGERFLNYVTKQNKKIRLQKIFELKQKLLFTDAVSEVQSD